MMKNLKITFIKQSSRRILKINKFLIEFIKKFIIKM